MNMESIILELLTRVQKLEKDVAMLKQSSLPADENAAPYAENLQNLSNGLSAVKDFPVMRKKDKPTELAKQYILNKFEKAKKSNLLSVEITAGEIGKALGISGRCPTACNAMNFFKQDCDEILETSPSGFTTRYKIKYNLGDRK